MKDNKIRLFKKISGKNRLILSLSGCLVLALFLIIFILNKANKNSYKTIDSLTKDCNSYTEQINHLKTEVCSLNKEIQSLKTEISLEDSIIGYYKQENDKNRLLYKQNQQRDKKIRDCEKKERSCLSEIEEKNIVINNYKRVIEILHSRHEIPILFLLNCSLKYYSSKSSKNIRITKELNRISRINGWQESCKGIIKSIDESIKSRYRIVKWAGLKAGCPYETSYFLIKEYNYDPENIKKEEFINILNDTFKSFPRDFKYCSEHIRKSFNSESETLQRIKKTIDCLKLNLGIES